MDQRTHGIKEQNFPVKIYSPAIVAGLVNKKKEEIEKMSMERQYELLLKNAPHHKFDGMKDLPQDGGGKKKKNKNCDGQKEENKEHGDGQGKTQEGGKNHAPRQNEKDGDSGTDKNTDKNKQNTGGGEGTDLKKDKDEGGKKKDKVMPAEDKDNKTAGDNGDKNEELVIQDGDPNLPKPEDDGEKIEKYWRDTVIQAIAYAKTIGKIPAGLVRYIEELEKPRIPWRYFVKKEILDGLGKNVVATWNRQSRRNQSLPGNKYLSKPTVYILVDSSGSIFEKELAAFLSESYALINQQGKGVIVPWDAKTYELIKLKKNCDFLDRTKGKIKGGGGTVIGPVLEKIVSIMKYGDVVVVLTDGEISDLENEKTKLFLKKIATKSARAIFATPKTEISLPLKWKKIRIEP